MVKKKSNPMNANYWYLQDKNSVHTVLFQYIQVLLKQNHYHFFELLRNHKLYSNQNIAAYSPFSYFRTMANQFDDFDHSTLNVVAACVDTAVSRIAGTQRPTVEFCTDNGDYKIQRQAKRLNEFIEGIFYQTELYKIAPQIVRDAALYGNGYLKIFESNGRVVAERAHPLELFVDNVEAIHR